MKRKITLAAFLFIAPFAFSQTCPVINFTYDAAGNRIQRVPGTVTCAPPPNFKQKENIKPSDKDGSLASALEINVYPNPAQDKISVDIAVNESKDNKTVIMSDVTGKTIYAETTSLQNLQIDVSGIALGLYYVTVTQGKNKATYSVLKK